MDKLTVHVYKNTPYSKYHSNISRYIYKLNWICISRRNMRQSYVNSVMIDGNKPVIRQINAPAHINTVRLTWANSEKSNQGWHLSESSTKNIFWNWICNPMEFYLYGLDPCQYTVSFRDRFGVKKATRQLCEIIQLQKIISDLKISVAKPHCIKIIISV